MRNKEFPLLEALKDLDRELGRAGAAEFELKVVGEFALLLNDIRKDPNAYTSVEYIGKDFDVAVREAIKKVGLKHHLGADWINNDLLLAGSTEEDLEFTTGKLHFTKALSLPVIQVSAIEKMDLLRMKVIMIDAEASALDYGGDFTREMDLKDIVLLAKNLEVNLSKYLISLEDEGFIVDDKTIPLIEDYEKSGECHFEQIAKHERMGTLPDYDEEEPFGNTTDVDNVIEKLEQM